MIILLKIDGILILSFNVFISKNHLKNDQWKAPWILQEVHLIKHWGGQVIYPSYSFHGALQYLSLKKDSGKLLEWIYS